MKTAAGAATSNERASAASAPDRQVPTAHSGIGASQEWSGNTIQLGSVLADRYQIKRLIARGGMGEVYEAHDLAREKLIALKTLTQCEGDRDEHDDGHSDAAQQLRAEVELAHRVTHKYVCRTFDLGVHRGESNAQVLFITMELVSGRSLTQHLRAAGPLTPVAACRLALRTLEGLEAAHEAGVLHRDLKSDNLMLRDSDDGDLIPVIMDFGLSKTLTSASTSGNGEQTLAGTLAYLAPEQLQGRCPRVTTDLYAFGLVVFEMLTAKLPFAAATPALAALKRLQEPAPSVQQFNAGVSSELALFVAKCLDRDPAQRFPSARAAREQLLQVPESLDAVHRSTVGAIDSAYFSTTKSSPGPSRDGSSVSLRLGLFALATVTLATLAVTWRPTPITEERVQGMQVGSINAAPALDVDALPSQSPAEDVSPAAPTNVIAPATTITSLPQPRGVKTDPVQPEPKTARESQRELTLPNAKRPPLTPTQSPTSSGVGNLEPKDDKPDTQVLKPASVQRATRECPRGMLCPRPAPD